MTLCTFGNVLLASLLAQTPPAPQLRIYPQTTDCTTTLQACISAANAGDIIDVATDGPIDESLSIGKSLTLRAAPGFKPVIGGGSEQRDLTFLVNQFNSSSNHSVTVQGLYLINTEAAAAIFAGGDHRFVFRNNVVEIDDDDSFRHGVTLRLEDGSIQALIEDNDMASPGNGVWAQIRSVSGANTIDIRRNRITTANPQFSLHGINIEVGADASLMTNVISNIIHGTGGENDFNRGINFALFQGHGDLTTNVSHNTIHGLAGNSRGVFLNANSLLASVVLDLFNNTVSAVPNSGFSILNLADGPMTLARQNNNSFANGMADTFLDSAAGAGLNVDPKFANAAAGNFQLRPGSMLIDATQNNTPLGSLTPDAAGNARPAGASADVGALEFEAEPLQLFTSLEAFTGLPAGTLASAPYPGPLNRPTEPFASGQISLDAIEPSTLFFDNWIPDPPIRQKGGIPQVVNELALNDHENLIIRSTTGPVFGMGIEFNDQAGGSSPSTFTLTALFNDVPVGELSLRTPNQPPVDFIGIWSPVPFDTLEITELAIANENEFFGQVYTSTKQAAEKLFADGFE